MAAGVSDCLVAVVRWFGGKKLGVPGLIAAYKAAAEEALAATTISHKTAR
jgi:putative IMPACT (imprinted ancient) family translation regulator